jgi:signal transduction histidine kinase
MRRNPLFSRTRWRLALSYAAVMVTILGAMGATMYYTMYQALRSGAEKELQALAGVLQDEIRPRLGQPDVVPLDLKATIPQLCRPQHNCPKATGHSSSYLRSLLVDSYYLQLFDRQGQLIASAGRQRPFLLNPQRQVVNWVQSNPGPAYLQVAAPLSTINQQNWGYLQISRNLQDIDASLREMRWLLVTSLPLAWVGILIASWLLAGFAMGPMYRSYQHIQQFTADAAHELRTPLAASQATIEATLWNTKPTWEQVKESLTIVQRQNQRLIQLVSDLLLLSQIDSSAYGGKNTAIRKGWEACCLNNIITDLDEELAAMAMAANIHLQTVVDVDYALWVWGNSDQIYRLITNLITNAVKYTPPQGKVTVFLRQRNRMVVVQVQDTGRGIDPTVQGRIFDRFYRVHDNRSRHEGGAGLGLAIVKSIATLHRGRLTVRSRVGEGSTFTLELPKLARKQKHQRR